MLRILLATLLFTVACGLKCYNHDDDMIAKSENATEVECEASHSCVSINGTNYRNCFLTIACGDKSICCDTDLCNTPAKNFPEQNVNPFPNSTVPEIDSTDTNSTSTKPETQPEIPKTPSTTTEPTSTSTSTTTSQPEKTSTTAEPVGTDGPEAVPKPIADPTTPEEEHESSDEVDSSSCLNSGSGLFMILLVLAYVLLILLLVSVFSTAHGLQCISHWNGSSPIEKNCVPQHERCFTRINATGELQSRGCAPNGRCNNANQYYSCCDSDLCNIHIPTVTTAEMEDTTTADSTTDAGEISTEIRSAADSTTTTTTSTFTTTIFPTTTMIENSTTQKPNSTEKTHRLTCYWHHSALGVPEERTCMEGQLCGTQVYSSGHTFKGCLRLEQCKKPIDIRTYIPVANGTSKWSVVFTACCDTDLCNAPLGCVIPSTTATTAFPAPSSTTIDPSEDSDVTTSAVISDSTTPNSVSSTENSSPKSEFGILIFAMLSYLLV